MMKKRSVLTLILLALFVLGGVRTHFVQGAPFSENALSSTSNASTAPWFIETVDSTNDVGHNASVAIDPLSGTMYISYFDNTNNDLKAAKYVGTGGNCGAHNDWQCETIDSSGDVGKYSSVAINPVNGWAGIAYYDGTHGALKVAAGCIGDSGCSWITATIDSGNPTTFLYDGQFPSLVYHSDGTAAIAYYTSSGLGNDYLKVAYYKGSGGNCGQGAIAGQWQCDTVDNGDRVGEYPSLALDSFGNRHIAYYDGGNNSLQYAFWNGSSYTIREILPTQSGQYTSLAVDIDHGNARYIAHYDNVNGKLEYATYVGTGGNCGFNSSSTTFEWQCDEIDDMGTGSSHDRGISIAVDGNGYPIIAYQSSGLASLKIARPVAALSLLIGNCGPVKSLFYTWQCDYVDNASLSDRNADYVSIVVNDAGLATIAYYGNANGSDGDLKVAYQRLQIFLPLAVKQWKQ